MEPDVAAEQRASEREVEASTSCNSRGAPILKAGFPTSGRLEQGKARFIFLIKFKRNIFRTEKKDPFCNLSGRKSYRIFIMCVCV